MQDSCFKLFPKHLVYKFRKCSKKAKNAVSLTMSWSETGPKLVTKMSVFTSVTRSGEAGNWDSDCLSTALTRSHRHTLTPKWGIYWLRLAISKIGPLCSPDNLLLIHEISQLIFFSGEQSLNMLLWEAETLQRSQLLLNEFFKSGHTFLTHTIAISHCKKNMLAYGRGLSFGILTQLAPSSRCLGCSSEAYTVRQRALLTVSARTGMFYKYCFPSLNHN